jgi:hypothetical protein
VSLHHSATIAAYELASGLTVSLNGDEGDFVEQ